MKQLYFIKYINYPGPSYTLECKLIYKFGKGYLFMSDYETKYLPKGNFKTVVSAIAAAKKHGWADCNALGANKRSYFLPYNKKRQA